MFTQSLLTPRPDVLRRIEIWGVELRMLHQLPNVSGSYILVPLCLRHDRKLCISVVSYKFAFALFVFFILYAVLGLSICSVVPVFVLCLDIT
jgi:hypothetical protein